jgi:hypothetical protein
MGEENPRYLSHTPDVPCLFPKPRAKLLPLEDLKITMSLLPSLFLRAYNFLWKIN